MNKAEFNSALVTASASTSGRVVPSAICRALDVLVPLVEQLEANNSAWRFWRTTAYRVALGVLRAIREHACPA